MGLVKQGPGHCLILDEVFLPLGQVVNNFILGLQSVRRNISRPIASDSSLNVIALENFASQAGPILRLVVLRCPNKGLNVLGTVIKNEFALIVRVGYSKLYEKAIIVLDKVLNFLVFAFEGLRCFAAIT